MREGDEATHAYYVRSGLIRTYQTLAEGRPQGLRLVGAGGMAGLDALGRREHISTVETVSPSVLCALSMADLERLSATDHRFCRAVCAYLIDEVGDLGERLHELSLRRSPRKLAAFLAAQVGDGGSLPADLYQRDVADFLAMSPETVCRVLAAFRSRGLVEMSGDRVRVRDPAGLRRIAGEDG